MWDTFSEASRHAIEQARRFAAEGSGCISPTLIFLGILAVSDDNSTIAALLTLSGVNEAEARLYALSVLEIIPAGPEAQLLTPGAKRILELAKKEAWRASSSTVEIEHLFIACLHPQRDAPLADVLRPLGLHAATLRRQVRELNRASSAARDELAEPTRKVLEAAYGAMRASFCGKISTAHLLLGLMADEESAAVQILVASDIDIEELRTLTRTQILSDGQIATSQHRFTVAAKRALDWAKEEANNCEQFQIWPEHILQGLLPHPQVISENWPLPSTIDDPLEKVWAQFPVDEIRRQYLKHPQPDAPAPLLMPSPQSWVKLEWRWMLGGFGFWLCGFAGALGAVGLGLGFLASFGLAFRGEVSRDYELRDRSGSFCYGLTIGFFVVTLWWIFQPTY